MGVFLILRMNATDCKARRTHPFSGRCAATRGTAQTSGRTDPRSFRGAVPAVRAAARVTRCTTHRVRSSTARGS